METGARVREAKHENTAANKGELRWRFFFTPLGLTSWGKELSRRGQPWRGRGRSGNQATHRAIEVRDALVRRRLVGDGDEAEATAAPSVHVGNYSHV
jgi:hypothetical protein